MDRPPLRPRLRLLAPAVLVAVVQVAGSAAAGARRSGVGPPQLFPDAAAARPLDALAVLLLLVGPAALLLRRRQPLLVQAVAGLAVVGWAVADRPAGPVWLSLVVATVSAAVHTAGAGRGQHRAAGYGVLAVTWALVWVVVPAARGVQLTTPALRGSLAWLLVLVGVCEVVRARRAAADDRRRTREQAALADAEERRRRASDERLAVARELHDVIGHSLSMITVQSGVALELMDGRPEVAREALTAIRAASRDALVEVHGVLASLRGADGADAATRSPAPTTADPDALVARARAAGLTVTTRAEGGLEGLPVAVDLAAARIVQEALTNVARHAGGVPAHVLLRRGAASLLVRVDDDGAAAAPPGGAARDDSPWPPSAAAGSGIPGMRERAGALGGRLAAGPRPRGGWRVEAELPLPASVDARAER